MNSTLNPQSSRATNFPLVLGLAVAFIAYYLAPILRWFGIEYGSGGPEMSIFWKVVAAALIVGFVRLIEKRRLESVNIKPPSEKDITWAFYLWGLSMGWYWIVSMFLPPVQSEGASTLANLHPLKVIGIILTAATVEELFYRGYLIERFHELTGRRWIGVLVSSLVFTIPHVQFFGPSWLLYHGVGAALL